MKNIRLFIACFMSVACLSGAVSDPFSPQKEIFTVSAASSKDVPSAELTYEMGKDGYIITGCSDPELIDREMPTLDVIIPDEIDGIPVTEVAEEAFYGRKIRKLVLGKNLIRIGAKAFVMKQTNQDDLIKELFVPESVEELGEMCIGWNKRSMMVPGNRTVSDYEHRIDDLKIYGSTDTVKKYVEENNKLYHFNVNTYLIYEDLSVAKKVQENMKFEDGVLSIGYLEAGANNFMAWEEYSENTKEIIIGEGADEIPKGAFKDFKALEKVTLPDSMIIINEEAFSGCTSLSEISLPENVYYLGKASFQNCTSLKNVNAESSLKIISAEAFSGCSALESIDLSDKMSLLDHKIFYGCKKLKISSFPKELKMIFTDFSDSNVFLSGIPENVLQIDENGKYINSETAEDMAVTFEDGVLTVSGTGVLPEGNIPVPEDVDPEEIKQIVIAEGITGISSDNFTSEIFKPVLYIYIPDSVKYIGDNAFYSSMNFDNFMSSGDGWKLRRVFFGNGLVYVGNEGLSLSFNSIYPVIMSLPDTLTYIGDKGIGFHSKDNAIQSGPKNISLPESLSFIGEKGLGYMIRPQTIKPTYTEFIGGKNSYAYIYAPENHFELHDKMVCYGDCNRDDSIDAADMLSLTEHLLGIEKENYEHYRFNVNSDFEINILDLIYLKNYLLDV